MVMDGKQELKRYNKLKSDRSNFDDRWDIMAPFIAPSRFGIRTKITPGDKLTRNVYDSTSMMSAEMMAQFIAGHIINPSQRWLEYQMWHPETRKDPQTREWLEENRDRTLNRARTSLFYAEGLETLIDYCGFGTGFILCEERPQPANRIIHGFRGFMFRAEKTGRYCIAEGVDGIVDSAWREFEITARLAMEREGWDPPEKIKKAMESGRPDDTFKFVHAVTPRPLAEQKAGNKGMPWASKWIEMDSGQVVYESGYRTFPAAVPRYMRTPGETYGRGRGDLAFPDTATLNEAKKMGLEDWALKIRPPILARNDSIVGTLRLIPGAPTYVNTRGQDIRSTLMPFESGSRPEISNIKEEELRRSIREIFYVDQIRMLMEVNKSEMSAFEFAKKLELLFRIMGPVYGRMEMEFLYQLVNTMFVTQYLARDFSPPPPAVERSDGIIDVVFHNPIARAQRSGDAEALTLAINDLSPMAQMDPSIWDWLKPDEVAAGILEVRGVPAKWVRSQREVTLKRAARHEQNQQENQMDMLGQGAEAAKNIAPLVKVLSDKAQPQAAA